MRISCLITTLAARGKRAVTSARASQNSLRWPAVAILVATVVALSVRAESPSVQVRWHDKEAKLSTQYLDDLRVGVERLAAGSLYAVSSKLPGTTPGLEVVVRYPASHSVELKTHPGQVVLVRQLTLYTSDSDNEGWPTLFASSHEGTWFLAKYSGPLTLDLLCSPQLEQYAPRAIRKNCHLGPSRRHGSDGASDASVGSTEP
jgi:hypothetical protein